jgi:hypothetical protein
MKLSDGSDFIEGKELGFEIQKLKTDKDKGRRPWDADAGAVPL